jgi:hypothetical protein
MHNYEDLDNTQLYVATDAQFARTIAGEELRSEVDVQLAAL